ncbi:hypothetical protein DPMN_191716 [Dreissena polymorpha]|uniref:Uncharacterized protein n=1 Tax=Dreissena polymorpha TaxID=45954 RepID=A0A9D3Y236_DREPO|nr:hypothetical protein DPMN_191716 [Dreissena polymorpha]
MLKLNEKVEIKQGFILTIVVSERYVVHRNMFMLDPDINANDGVGITKHNITSLLERRLQTMIKCHVR